MISRGEECVRSFSRLQEHNPKVRGWSPQSDVAISQVCEFIRVAYAVGLKTARLAQVRILNVQAKISYLVVILLCHLGHVQHSGQALVQRLRTSIIAGLSLYAAPIVGYQN